MTLSKTGRKPRERVYQPCYYMDLLFLQGLANNHEYLDDLDDLGNPRCPLCVKYIPCGEMNIEKAAILDYPPQKGTSNAVRSKQRCNHAYLSIQRIKVSIDAVHDTLYGGSEMAPCHDPQRPFLAVYVHSSP